MLSLSKFSLTVDNKSIVQDFSLNLKSGTIHALMGPNGSGKSSLSLTLAGHPGYILDNSAKIMLDNNDLTHLSPDQRAKFGLFLSFQNPVSIPGLTVKQLIKLIADHLRPEKTPVKELLTEIKHYAEILHIKSELLDRSVNDNFSGGEKKRIEMLQLLMARPKYALIDEIDSGLDVDAIKTIGTAINQAKTTYGTGFLIITHYRRILDYVQPDQVHILSKGKLVQSGGRELIDDIDQHGFKSIH